MGAPTYFASAATPTDNLTGAEPVTAVITPPGSMVAGDLVQIGGVFQVATAGQITQSQLGNQTWIEIGESLGNDMSFRSWWCRYNGTFSANPSIAFAAQGGTQPCTAFMHVFRPTATSWLWGVDVAMQAATFAAPGSPFTVTRNGQASLRNDTVQIAGWAAAAANTWGTLAGAGWAVTGTAQYRNTSGTALSASFAHLLASAPTAAVNVSKNESAGTAGVTYVATFYSWDPITDQFGGTLGKGQQDYMFTPRRAVGY